MDFRISIDDGHPDDLRIFSLLKQHGLIDIATFYIAPYNHQRPVMSPYQINKLSLEAEIGGHTLTHHWLTDLDSDEQNIEIQEGKKILEEITEKKITKFCYPRGYFNQDIKKIVAFHGFTEARTMKQGSISTKDLTDPFEIPITIHSHPNYIEEWKSALNASTEIEKQTGKGYFHITMHGWEVEKFNLWEKINEIFYAIAHTRN